MVTTEWGWSTGRFGSRPTKEKMQVPFDFAQGRLSTPLKSASLRMTAFFAMLLENKKQPQVPFDFAQGRLLKSCRFKASAHGWRLGRHQYSRSGERRYSNAQSCVRGVECQLGNRRYFGNSNSLVTVWVESRYPVVSVLGPTEGVFQPQCLSKRPRKFGTTAT
jgi:hypothetical protein